MKRLPLGRRIALATCALSLLLPAAAEARTVTCGEVITEDTRVDNDLSCPESLPALQIGADGVELDLGGHTIESTTPRDGSWAIRSAGFDDVTVRNGTAVSVSGQMTAVDLTGNGVRVLDVVARAYVGVFIIGSDSVVARSEMQYGWGGIVMLGDRNRATRNTSTGYQGLEMNGKGNYAAGNEFTGNIDLYGDQAIAWGNTVGGFGVNGRGHIVARNAVTGSGIRVGSAFASATGTRLVENTVSGSEMSGITIAGGSTGSVLTGNLTSDNADDGIHVDEPATSLRRNVARHNGDLGIEAVAGVRDGGGNRAFDNGNPAQCVNVAC